MKVFLESVSRHLKLWMLVCSLLVTGQAQLRAAGALRDSLGVFNHLGLGVAVGTSGVSLELATPITRHFVLKGGVNLINKGHYHTDLGERVLGVETLETVKEVAEILGVRMPSTEITADIQLSKMHLLLDYFPWRRSGFHFTAGFYLGYKKLIKVRNREKGALKAVNEANKILVALGYGDPETKVGQVGLQWGTYYLTPDAEGNVEATCTVNRFRPYLGVGFMRPISQKHFLTFGVDLGVQFWGEPKVWVNGEQRIKHSNVRGEDGGVLRFVNNVVVWPVLNLRLMGKIF